MSEQANKAGVRDWVDQINAWTIAEQNHMRNAWIAKGYGFNPDQYTRPFPGSVSSNVFNLNLPEKTTEKTVEKTTTSSNPSPQSVSPPGPGAGTSPAPALLNGNAWKILTALALLLGGAGLTAGILSSSGGDSSKVSELEREVERVKKMKVEPIDLEIKYWTEDGKKGATVREIPKDK